MHAVVTDVAALAATVREVTADPDTFDTLRRGAAARARRYGWPEIADCYIALAEEVRRGRAAAA